MPKYTPIPGGNRITQRLDRVLRNVEKEKYGFHRSYLILLDELKQIYQTATVEEVIGRKYYLEHCMSTPQSLFTSLVFALFSWCSIELIQYIFEVPSSETYTFVALKFICVVIILCFLYFHFTKDFRKCDQLYLKYNLKEVEWSLIDSILKRELHTDMAVDEIISNRYQDKPAQLTHPATKQSQQPEPSGNGDLCNLTEDEQSKPKTTRQTL